MTRHEDPSEAGRHVHLFGPVPSRRLGRSLGIDLVPHKVCTLDCVYCECGATTDLTLERRRWVDTDAVLAELTDWLETGDADYLTFSGAGEPTLHADLGRIAAWLAERTTIPRALLTNSTLLTDPGLRAELEPITLVSPSLDAVSQDVFERLNRPHPGLRAADLVEGLVALRAEHPGQMWLEVLLVGGVNDTDRELDLLAEAIGRIAPDRVQLNTAVRPGTEADVSAASEQTLRRALDRFGPRAEAIATFSAPSPSPADGDASASDASAVGAHAEAVLAVVRRRPETVAALAASLDIDEATLARCIDTLRAAGRVRVEHRAGHDYVIASDRA